MLKVDCTIDNLDWERLTSFDFITWEVDDKVAYFLALEGKMNQSQFHYIVEFYRPIVKKKAENILWTDHWWMKIGMVVDRVIH